MNYDAKLARHLVSSGMIDDVVLVDVGCSAGIDASLRQLEPNLAGVGIDPLLNEVERLKGIETNPKLTYVAAFIVSDRDYPPSTYQPSNWFYRSQAAQALDPEADFVGKLIGEDKT